MCYLIVCVFSDASCIFFCAFRDLFTLLKCYIALCIFMLFILSFLLQIVSVNALYFVIQTQWAPIADDNQTCTTVSSSPDIQPDVNNTTPTLTTDASTSCPSVSTTPRCVPTPVRHRPNPLPVFEWADSRQMWEMMMSKEELAGYHRDSSWFTRHTLLQPRMRTVLLDWLMEVVLFYFLVQ